MKRAVQLSLIAALLTGCVDADKQWTNWDGRVWDSQGGTGDTLAGLISLSILPHNATITHKINETKKVTFKVMGTFASGEKDLTAHAYLSLDGLDLGRFEGATLSISKNLGGKTKVMALVGSIKATTPLLIHVKDSLVIPGAPKDAATKFKTPCTGGGTIKVVYPEEGTMVPPNLADFTVMWTDDKSDLWELTVKSGLTELMIYTTKKKHRLSGGSWSVIAPSNLGGSLKISIRGVKKATPSSCTMPSPLEVLIGPAEIKGGVYYWVTTPDNAIIRYDFGHADRKPVTFISKKSAGTCVGCHSVSPDGTRLGYSKQEEGTVMDVKTKKTLSIKPAYNASFQVFTPDNKHLFSSYKGTMSLRDGATGALLSTLKLGGLAAQPELTPKGDALVFVRPLSYGWFTTLYGGSILTASLNGTTLGTPKVLVKGSGPYNNYYPSFSPDGKWIIYNHSRSGSYSNNGAELWVIPTSGGDPIRLARANLAKALRNSWARWSPFAQMYKGKLLYWFSFSSIRDYGTDLVNSTKSLEDALPQIWMAAFDPSLAKAGKDPSFPAFWLPFQDLTSNNHIAQWTKKVPEVE